MRLKTDFWHETNKDWQRKYIQQTTIQTTFALATIAIIWAKEAIDGTQVLTAIAAAIIAVNTITWLSYKKWQKEQLHGTNQK